MKYKDGLYRSEPYSMGAEQRAGQETDTALERVEVHLKRYSPYLIRYDFQ